MAHGLGAGLSQLKRQFDQWRAGRKVGERIPVELWSGAVAAPVEHSAYRVAAAPSSRAPMGRMAPSGFIGDN
jgi:hypothetical protein